MWFAVTMLFLLGFRIAQQSGRSIRNCIGLGFVDASIGALIVLIKVIAH